MLKVYKDSSPSPSTVYNQIAELKYGRKNHQDGMRRERPKRCIDTRNYKNTEHDFGISLKDRHLI